MFPPAICRSALLSLLLLNPFAFGAEKAKRAAKEGDEPVRMPADLKIEQGIVFKTVGEKKLDLLLIQPAEKKFERAPLVLYIHGGGWGGGDKFKVFRGDVLGTVRDLSHRGFLCASLEYRLVDGEPTNCLDAVADCKDALRFLVAHAAEYGFDPERIGTFGSSAGGHLTLTTALGDEKDYPCDKSIGGAPVKVRCVAAFYPLVSMHDPELFKGSNFARPQRLMPILGGKPEEKLDVAKKLSPIEMVRKDGPAIFLAHGDNDQVLSFQNSLAMEAAARAKGEPVQCIISKGAGHGFGGEGISPTIPEIYKAAAEFFYRNLAPR